MQVGFQIVYLVFVAHLSFGRRLQSANVSERNSQWRRFSVEGGCIE